MIEQEVRDMLASKVRHAPALDEPPTQVLRRARGRRALNTAGVVAAVAVVAVGSLIGVRTLGTQDVKQLAPLPDIVPWAHKTVFSVPNSPPCKAADLVFTVDPGVDSRLSFVLTRRDSICALGTPAALRVRGADGKDVDIRIARAGSFGGTIYLEGVSRRSDMLFTWNDGCVPGGPTRFELTLPRGGGTLVAQAADRPMACYGTGPLTLTLDAFGTTGLRDPGSIGQLGVAIERVPATIAAGDTLRYVVRLANPTRKPIELDPCPTVLQTLIPNFRAAEHDEVSLQTKMNCAAAPLAVPARRSVRFAMEFVVPRGSPTGYAQISWRLNDATGSTANFLLR